MTARRDEAGMTLIELLIGTACLGIIIFPLTGAMYAGLVTNQATVQRTADSAGAQLTSSYFVTDVQSADAVRTGAPFTCGGSNTKLELQWTDADNRPLAPPPVVTAITYDAVAGPNDTALVRTAFTVSGGSCSQGSVVRLVPALNSAQPPVLTCTPSCASAQQVSLQVSAFSTQPNKNGYYSAYTFNLTGTRRVS